MPGMKSCSSNGGRIWLSKSENSKIAEQFCFETKLLGTQFWKPLFGGQCGDQYGGKWNLTPNCLIWQKMTRTLAGTFILKYGNCWIHVEGNLIIMLKVYPHHEHTSYLSREPRVYPCKFFLAGVNFYRFNAKNWPFWQILREKVAFFLQI